MNMEYCKFQNTCGDLDECIETLRAGKLADLSSDERDAAHEMLTLCRDYAQLCEDLGFGSSEK